MKKLFVFLIFLLPIACIFGGLYLWNTHTNPDIIWDTSSSSIVINYERRYEIDYNYIPTFRIWGDGHIIWVEYTPSGERKVLEGYLSQDEIGELLKQFKDTGFFKRCYKNQNYALNYVRINLVNTSCSALIENEVSLNPATLIGKLMAGAGVDGKEFIPEEGYLFVVPYEKTERFRYEPEIQPEFIWSDEILGFDLESLYNSQNDQIKIEGEELLFAWKIVSSPSAIVESNGKIYWIAVIIPKITE